MRQDPARLAALAAEKLILDLGFTELAIDPFEIARVKKIDVLKKPAGSAGVSGMLVRRDSSFAIGYSTRIESEGFQRFSVAHELGHYFLPGHVEAVFRDTDTHESHAGFSSSDPYEIEADQFAASLLMPKRLFTPALDRVGKKGMDAVISLAELCKTSLPATAIRIAQCTPDPLAIVMTAGDKIEFCFMSNELRELDGIDWLRKRQAVPRNTPTFEFNKDPRNISSARRVRGNSELQEWFGGHREIEVNEDVIGLGEYGKTLSILYGFELPEPEDEEESERLEDIRMPRFRK